MISARDFLRQQLGGGLRSLPELDRLAAAWPLVCGAAMASHGRLLSYAEGTLHIEVIDPAWRAQMMACQSLLAGDLARVAGVPVTALHFERHSMS
jgi:hypothetical protein